MSLLVMRILSCRHLVAAMLAVSLLAVSIEGFAQDAPQEAMVDPVFRSWSKQDGVAGCARCHFSTSSSTNPFTGGGEFSRQNEMSFWLERDKHAIARRRVEPLTQAEMVEEAKALGESLGIQSVPADWFGLSNVLSRRICDKLGYNVKTADGYNQFRNNCLTCHGGYSGAADNEHFSLGGTNQPGISCNYCHQIGGTDQWLDQHWSSPQNNDAWRLLAPQSKEQAGMRDLVNVQKQADLCFDCHIGNRKKNQFVTHEMYAAGHPPIPSIELHTFVDQMPSHWRTPGELHDSLAQWNGRDRYFSVNYGNAIASKADSMMWNTRKMLIGAAVARKKSAELFVDSIEMAQKKEPNNKYAFWADYSLYDCASCHHELLTNSRRRTRGYSHDPGRPRQAEWTGILYHSLFKGTALHNQGLEDALSDAVAAKPFGDRELVLPAAKQIQQSLATTAQRLGGVAINPDAAKNSFLMKLLSASREDLLTYDAARQVVWASETIAAELSSTGKVSGPFARLGDPNVTGIQSKLPSGRAEFIYRESLTEDLDRRRVFDPARLIKELTAIRQRLAAVRTDPPTVVLNRRP